MDKEGLFIDKHVSDNQLIGDAALRKQVTRPKDLCAALSEVTDGTVFSKAMLAQQRTSVQKSFIDVLVRLVVKMAEPSDCQRCECVADNAMAGQAVCHHCEMNPIYNVSVLYICITSHITLTSYEIHNLTQSHCQHPCIELTSNTCF